MDELYKRSKVKNAALAAAVARSGKTYAQVAEEAGVTRNSISLYLNYRICPRKAIAERIGAVLGTTSRDLGFSE